jgi:hypothetical protein
MSQNNTFRTTPIPHRTKFGEPMAYYTLSDDGKVHTETSRAGCLARIEEPNNPFPQRWYVDEESGLVVRLPRNQKGEELARDNMRYIWREDKRQERKASCIVESPLPDNLRKMPNEYHLRIKAQGEMRPFMRQEMRILLPNSDQRSRVG